MIGPSLPRNISAVSTSCPDGGRSAVMPGGQPDGRERGHRLEQHVVEPELGDAEQGHGGHRDQPDPEQRDGERLALHGAGEAPVTDVHGRLAADLRPDHERQQREGGDLDPARGSGAAAADEHQHVGDQQRRGVHSPTSTLLNPAVRGMTPWKSPTTSFPPRSNPPMVPSLFHSAIRNAPTPTTTRIA